MALYPQILIWPVWAWKEPQQESSMLPYLQILAWPVTVLLVALILRPVLAPLLTRSKVKVELFGVTIETDLATLEAAMTQGIGGVLTEDETTYLQDLVEIVEKPYPDGIAKEDREFFRPMRNAGLIMTLPRGSALGMAKSIRLTKLGRLVMKGNLRDKPKRRPARGGGEGRERVA